MQKNPLQTVLDDLWAGYVDRVQFDILGRRILFEVTLTCQERVTEYKLVFGGVASFYFVNDTGERRLRMFPPTEEAALEMTSVSYYEQGVGRVAITSQTEDWVQQWWASANFTVELAFISTLFIEASHVTVNDREYEVGYPRTSLSLSARKP